MLTSHDLGVHIHKTRSPRYQSTPCPLSSLSKGPTILPHKHYTQELLHWIELAMSIWSFRSVIGISGQRPAGGPGTVNTYFSLHCGKRMFSGQSRKIVLALRLFTSQKGQSVSLPLTMRQERQWKYKSTQASVPSLWGQRFDCWVSPLILSSWSLRLLLWRTPISVCISFSKANRWQTRMHEHLWYPSSWTNSQADLITGSISPPSKR